MSHDLQTLSFKVCRQVKIDSPGDFKETCGRVIALLTDDASNHTAGICMASGKLLGRLRHACASNRSCSP